MSLKDATSIERLGANNYATWSTDVKWALIMKGLWAAVDEADSVDAADDIKALAFIGLTVEKHIKATIDACDTAREAWDKLEETYKAKSSALKMKLKKDLVNLQLEVKEDITTYVARATEIRDQLAAAGVDVDAQELTMAVLGGLPDNYGSMVDSIMIAAGDMMEIEELIPKLMIIEQRVKERSTTDYHKAYTMTDNEKTCWKCGKKGHIQRECPDKKPSVFIPGKTRVFIQKPPKKKWTSSNHVVAL